MYCDVASSHLTSRDERPIIAMDLAARKARGNDGEPVTIWGHFSQSSNGHWMHARFCSSVPCCCGAFVRKTMMTTSAIYARFSGTRSSRPRCRWPLCPTTRGTRLVDAVTQTVTYTDAATCAATAAPAPVIEYVVPAPAVACDEPVPVIEWRPHLLSPLQHQLLCVAPAPEFHAVPAAVIEHVAPAHAVIYTAPAPVIEDVALAPDVTYDEPAPVIEYVAPAPAVFHAVPAPVTEHVAPTPAVIHTQRLLQ